MFIRPVEESDASEWLRMRMALWPDSNPNKENNEIKQFLLNPSRPVLATLQAVFVCQSSEAGLCGFVEVGIRPYADGCETTDVGYLEAWYVDPDARRTGRQRTHGAYASPFAGFALAFCCPDPQSTLVQPAGCEDSGCATGRGPISK